MKTEEQMLAKLDELNTALGKSAEGITPGDELSPEKQAEIASLLGALGMLYWAAGMEDIFKAVFGGIASAQTVKNLTAAP